MLGRTVSSGLGRDPQHGAQTQRLANDSFRVLLFEMRGSAGARNQ
jgi:hypothetical protein